MKTPTITNVECKTGWDDDMSISFDHANARYHFWINPDSLEIGRATGHKSPTLYKNPPPGTAQLSSEYFHTRKMDCTKGPSKALVDLALRIARQEGLIDKARQAAEENKNEAAELREKEIADKRVRDAAYEMLAALLEIIEEFDSGPLVDRARRAVQLAGGDGAPAPLGPIAVILDGGLCQGVVTGDQRLEGVTFAVIDYDTEGADADQISKVAQLDAGDNHGEEEACVRIEEIGRALIDVPETIARRQEPVGATMPDGTQVRPWDERLRAAGGSPIYG